MTSVTKLIVSKPVLVSSLILFLGLVGAWHVPNRETAAATSAEAVEGQESGYARALGITEAEASIRLQLQEEVGLRLGELRIDDRPSIAGVWFEHAPEFSLTVWLIHPDEQLESMLRSFGIPVEFKREPALSVTDLRKAQALAAMSVRPQLPIAGVGVDVKTNSVVVELQPGSLSESELQSEATRLTATTGALVRISQLNSHVSDDVMRGGRSVGSCTTGFAIGTYSGAYGFLTSAHCLDLYNLTSCALTYDSTAASCWRNHSYGASTDVQHRTVPGDSAAAEFWNGGSYVPVQGAYSWASQQVGWYTCHYGVNTGNSCGTIYNKYYQPNYQGACPGGSCNADWIQVTNPGWTSLACDSGDSGGPWFGSTSAYGIHKTSPGSSCVYMPIDRITAMSVFVLTQ